MSTTAFGLGSKYFALYEVAGVGIQWRTISQSPVEGDDFNLGLAMTMLIMDAAVYGVLTWYIEAVHPGESRPVQARAPCTPAAAALTQQGSASYAPPAGMYGLPRPWYFPLQRSYWSGSGRAETWDWPWCGGSSTRLSVMEEDQASAMDQRRTGRDHTRVLGGACWFLWLPTSEGSGFRAEACWSTRPSLTASTLPSRCWSCLTVSSCSSGAFMQFSCLPAGELRGVEEEPSHLPLVVCIDKLTKVYKPGSKVALNKLSLNLHENQVVSFLGHNGAGKTTTM